MSADLAKELADAEEMLRTCKDELANAQHAGNSRYIAQYKRYVAEARMHRDDAKKALDQAQGPTWLVKPT